MFHHVQVSNLTQNVILNSVVRALIVQRSVNVSHLQIFKNLILLINTTNITQIVDDMLFKFSTYFELLMDVLMYLQT